MCSRTGLSRSARMTLCADVLLEFIACSLPNMTRMSSDTGDVFMRIRECARYRHVL
jgi:hypothetical protein